MAKGDEKKLKKEIEKEKKKIKELEKEKRLLENKSEDLAEIIEEISEEEEKKEKRNEIANLIGSKLKEMNEKIENKLKEMKDMKESKTKPKTDVRKQVSSIVKEKIDSRLSEIGEKLKGLDKISTLEDKVNTLSEKLSSKTVQPRQTGDVSQGLASFGEEIDFQSELLDIKKDIDSLSKGLDKFQKRMDYTISRIEERLKELDKLSTLEENYQEITEKLGPENVQKLRKLIFSSDELVDEIIPDLVSKKLRHKVDPVISSAKSIKANVDELNSRIKQMRSEIKDLTTLKDSISELKKESEKQSKRFDEQDERFLHELENSRAGFKKKLEKLAEKTEGEIAKVKEATSPKTVETSVKDVFSSLLRPRIAEIEKQQIIIDEKINELEKENKELEGRIESMEAPQNVKRWVESESQEIKRGLDSEIDFLKKELFKHSDGISSLREKVISLNTSVSDISKRLTDQTASFKKILDVKESFVERAENFGAEINNIKDKISSERERLTMLEQDSRKFESRLDMVTKGLMKSQNAVSEIAEIEKNLNKLEKTNRVLDNRITSNEGFGVKLKEMEKELSDVKRRQIKTENKVTSDLAKLEQTVKQAILERKISEEKEKKEKKRISKLLHELRE